MLDEGEQPVVGDPSAVGRVLSPPHAQRAVWDSVALADRPVYGHLRALIEVSGQSDAQAPPLVEDGHVEARLVKPAAGLDLPRFGALLAGTTGDSSA